MNNTSHNGGFDRLLFTSVGPKGLDVSWVGPNPFAEGFSYGTEDGLFVLTDIHGSIIHKPEKGSDSAEAINAIARSGDCLALSTRAEINLIGKSTVCERIGTTVFPYGAHGVCVLSNGDFVAPLGRTGLVILKPCIESRQPVAWLAPVSDGFHYYRVIALGENAGHNLVISAGRTGGLGVTDYVEGQVRQKLTTLISENLDVIDVCSLGTGTHPFAVAALGQDGALILLKDALKYETASTLKFPTVAGRAYRLLSCRGDLYVLTSHGLFGLLGLAERFLADTLVNGPPTRILRLTMEAVDANMVADRWLMVVLPGEVRKYDVQLIHEKASRHSQYGEFQNFRPTPLAPQWEVQDRSQTLREIASVHS